MAQRPSRDSVLIQSAWLWSERSTCSRLHVGAVFAQDGRILATGYNGAPAGVDHCDHTCDCDSEVLYFGSSPLKTRHEENCNSLKPCQWAEHAERNAIAFAARYGVALAGSSLYVTHMPCLSCAMSIINAGVKEVHYVRPYRLDDGVKLMERVGIMVVPETDRGAFF